LVRAQQPSFEQGGYAVDARHQLGCGLLLPLKKRDLVLVAVTLQGRVSQPAIGVDDTTWCDRFLYEGHEALRGSIHNLTHANPANPRAIFLSGNDYQRFLQIEPSAQVLFRKAKKLALELDKNFPLNTLMQKIDLRSVRSATVLDNDLPRRFNCWNRQLRTN